MLKLYKIENEYSANELAELYPGFHYTAELIKCLKYDAEKDVYISSGDLPTYEMIMNKMAELYRVASVDFKKYLLKQINYLESQLFAFSGKETTGNKNKDVIAEVKQLINDIDFPEISADLVIEPVRMMKEGTEAVLQNIVYAVKLIQDYYKSYFPPESEVIMQLEEIAEELFNIEI